MKEYHGKEMEHHHMPKHDGGHADLGSCDTAEMKRMNEPPVHEKAGLSIVHHQEHFEGEHQHVHRIHHFGEHGKGHKS